MLEFCDFAAMQEERYLSNGKVEMRLLIEVLPPTQESEPQIPTVSDTHNPHAQ